LYGEPHPLLRIRERDRFVAWRRPDFEPSAVARCWSSVRARLLFDLRGQKRSSRRIEQRAQLQLDSESCTDLRDHLRRRQRVSAQLEEVVINAGVINLKHARPNLQQLLFDL
jgi:hypothetical protein